MSTPWITAEYLSLSKMCLANDTSNVKKAAAYLRQCTSTEEALRRMNQEALSEEMTDDQWSELSPVERFLTGALHENPKKVAEFLSRECEELAPNDEVSDRDLAYIIWVAHTTVCRRERL